MGVATITQFNKPSDYNKQLTSFHFLVINIDKLG
jgi:hypothetical protein